MSIFGKHSIQNTVSNIADSVKSKAMDKLAESNLPDLQTWKEKTGTQLRGIFKPKESEEMPEIVRMEAIPTRCAIKIIYFLMAADGEIFHSEEEKFDSIGRELSLDYDRFRAQLTRECKTWLRGENDPEDYFDALRDGINAALRAETDPEDSSISPKLLMWDLLAISYSDGQYNKEEQRLLKYIIRKLDFDRSVFLEMETSIQTLLSLDEEIRWVQTTDRPYMTIKAIEKELSKRKNTVYNSIIDLIGM